MDLNMVKKRKQIIVGELWKWANWYADSRKLSRFNHRAIAAFLSD